MQQIIVYIPRTGEPATRHIAQGSGIVGAPTAHSGTVLIYYEGAIYRQANIVTFADRVLHAYYRMTEDAPTTAKAVVPTASLIALGTFDAQGGIVHLTGSESERDLAAWLTTRTLDAAELRVSRR
jgi:hypothetical protein